MKNFLVLFLVLGLVACSLDLNSKKGLGTVGASTPRLGVGLPVAHQAFENVLTLNGATASQVILGNSLKVTLISSPTSKKAAASVAVKVGHKDNPVEAQGLAHYLEHMLFLGTDEFPVVGDYKKFLNENNGRSNAYTSTDHTNYFLQVRPDKFDEAVHRLSRFFVSPKFYDENIDKEKNAVHNEFNFRFEAFKPRRVFSAFQKESSKNRFFSIGNKESLEATTAAYTRRFFEEHYHTEAMHAILAGPQSLEELEKLAKKYFSDFRSNPNKPINSYSKFLDLDFDQLPAKVNLKPQGVEKKLNIMIPVVEPVEINEKLFSVLGTLIGDEGEESLMVFLQNKGLIKNGGGALSGGVNASGASLTLSLTDKGAKKQNQILSYIAGYLNFLKEEGLPEHLNSEVTKSEKASKIAVSFYEITGSVLQGVNGDYMGSEVFPETLEELFFGKPSVDVTNEEYIELLNSLDWNKVFLIFTHPDNKDVEYAHKKLENIELGGLKVQTVKGQRLVTDSIYKFAFSVDQPQVSKIKAKGSFQLKKENVYIPENFDLYTSDQPPVYTEKTSEVGSIYYSALTEVNAPKSYMNLYFYSDQIDFLNHSDVVSLYLLRELLEFQTANKSYSMVAAGFNLGFSLDSKNGALGVSLAGWSDTFIKAFSDTLSFTSLESAAVEFNKVKDLYTENIKLEEAGDVQELGVRGMRAQIEHARLSFSETHTALDSIDYAKFLEFVKRYKSGLHLRGALSGNIKTSFVEDIVSSLEKEWAPSWVEAQSWSKLYELESIMGKRNTEGELPLFEAYLEGNHPEEVFYYGYWNFGKTESLKEKLISRILGDWLSPDYYTELRTKRGLAYSLNAWGFEHMNNIGMAMYLQSSTNTIDDVEKQVDEYVQTWLREILPTKKEGLLKRTGDSYILKQEMPAEPEAIHKKYVNFVNLGYKTVDEYKKTLAPLSEITLKDVVSYGQKNLLDKKKVGSFVKVSRKK